MSDEYRDPGFVIDLVSQSCVFEGGFACPVVAMLDGRGDETIDPEEAEYAVVKVPPDGFCITVDLQALREEGHDKPIAH